MVVKMEHVLILVIAAFIVYHFVGRCSCMRSRNGFSVGGTDIDYCEYIPGTEKCYNKCIDLGYNCKECWGACAYSKSLSQKSRIDWINEHYTKVDKCTEETSHDPDDKCKFYETLDNFAIYCKPKFEGQFPFYYPCELKGKDDVNPIYYIGPQL